MADLPPIVIERVLEVPPNTKLQMLVDGRIVQSIDVPAGRTRIFLCIGARCGSWHRPAPKRME